jgi:hypothetical protein
MDTRLRTSLAACIALAFTTALSSGAAPREETHRYTGVAVVTVGQGCPITNALWGETESNVAGSCFAIEAGETQADFVVSDTTGLPVGGAFYFLDETSGLLGDETLFCATGSKQVPAGAAYLAVDLDVIGAIPCFDSAPFGVATLGHITATFS